MKPLVLLPTTAIDADCKSLTDLQRNLVDVIVAGENGDGISLTQAAVDAGYGGTREVARISATRALQTPHVQKYLRKCLEDEFQIGAVSAYKTLERLVTGGRSEYVRMQAASTILDRAGYSKSETTLAINTDSLNVNIDLSD
jgi:hypothetical protein